MSQAQLLAPASVASASHRPAAQSHRNRAPHAPITLFTVRRNQPDHACREHAKTVPVPAADVDVAQNLAVAAFLAGALLTVLTLTLAVLEPSSWTLAAVVAAQTPVAAFLVAHHHLQRAQRRALQRVESRRAVRS